MSTLSGLGRRTGGGNSLGNGGRIPSREGVGSGAVCTGTRSRVRVRGIARHEKGRAICGSDSAVVEGHCATGAGRWLRPRFVKRGRLFIGRPAIRKTPHAFAPCAIAAGLEIISHQDFNSIRRKTVLVLNHEKSVMIAERHRDDFADGCLVRLAGVCHG